MHGYTLSEAVEQSPRRGRYRPVKPPSPTAPVPSIWKTDAFNGLFLDAYLANADVQGDAAWSLELLMSTSARILQSNSLVLSEQEKKTMRHALVTIKIAVDLSRKVRVNHIIRYLVLTEEGGASA